MGVPKAFSLRRLALVGAGVLGVLGLAFLGYRNAPRVTPTGQPPIAFLTPRDAAPFTKAFDGAPDRRVVALLSPT